MVNEQILLSTYYLLLFTCQIRTRKLKVEANKKNMKSPTEVRIELSSLFDTKFEFFYKIFLSISENIRHWIVNLK